MAENPSFLLVGIDSNVKKIIDPVVGQRTSLISEAGDFEKLIEGELSYQPLAVLCGSAIEGVSKTEMAQGLRMIFSDKPILYVSSDRSEYDQKALKKNGFDDSFLFPLDQAVFKKAIDQLKAQAGEGEIIYRSVKLIDIQPNDELNFDLHLFMPMNKKYIKYVGKGSSISEDQQGRLAKHDVGSVFVDQSEMGQFYEYTANRLKALNKKDGALSETERQERLETSVRAIFTGIFSTAASDASVGHGKALMEEAQETIKTYVLDSEMSDIYKKIISQVSIEEEGYQHSTNVSVYAALFSMGAGIGKPEELSLGGLLHDLGKLELPDEIQNKNEEDLEASERVFYEEHPEKSIKIIKERKLVVPEVIHKAILQHHETFTGSGFPKGVSGKTFKPESQILAMANRFDEMTRIVAGKRRFTAKEAIEYFQSNQLYDPEILKKVKKLFPQ